MSAPYVDPFPIAAGVGTREWANECEARYARAMTEAGSRIAELRAMCPHGGCTIWFFGGIPDMRCVYCRLVDGIFDAYGCQD